MQFQPFSTFQDNVHQKNGGGLSLDMSYRSVEKFFEHVEQVEHISNTEWNVVGGII